MHPRLLHLSLALGGWLALALAARTTPQSQGLPPQPGSPQVGDDTPTLKSFKNRRVAELHEQIEGAWRLMSFQRMDDASLKSAFIDGFATFQHGYMSIIIHTEDVDEDYELVPFFQAGIHHYRIDPGSLRLQTAVVIAHHNLDEELPAYEIPYTPREFNLTVLKNELRLERPDGSTLRFRRATSGAFPTKAELLIERGRDGKNAPVIEDSREGDPFMRRRFK